MCGSIEVYIYIDIRIVWSISGVVEGIDTTRLFPISTSSDSSPREQKNSDKSQAPLYLNVYDLTPINNYLYWVGCGVIHSGIEVSLAGFGAHEYPTSGVFEVEPRGCPGFLFRHAIHLGSTDMSHSEFRSFMEHLSNDYHGDTYNLISKNCNHFTDEVCQRLTGKFIPGWVNRLARMGSFCNCLLPESIQATQVANLPDVEMCSGKFYKIALDDIYKLYHAVHHLLILEDKSRLFFHIYNERVKVKLIFLEVLITVEERVKALNMVSNKDGADNGAAYATGESEYEEIDHHLITTASSEIAFLKDKPVRLAKDIL
ncbi:hypothetical protein SASPL_145582 [Salvia splendens]|uniref:PPPDE domain-containing protein n=1 Tax=Salvia splendens TaxID=180675 RepID=A0A8X8Z7T4_SALSN|nr:hypothetical protein SASPL_145582 [Salvia splendens]